MAAWAPRLKGRGFVSGEKKSIRDDLTHGVFYCFHRNDIDILCLSWWFVSSRLAVITPGDEKREALSIQSVRSMCCASPPPLLITSSLGWKKTSTITNIIRNCHYKPCSQRLTFCRQTLTINDFQWKTVQKLLTLKRSLILHERVSLCLAIAELFPAHY